MFTANRVATNISSAQRSLYMLLAVLWLLPVLLLLQTAPLILKFSWNGNHPSIVWTIIPPLLFNAVSTNRNWSWEYRSLELPVSVLMAYFYWMKGNSDPMD
jgi:hypothetical protein